MTVTDPDDPLLILAAEVRVLAASVAESTTKVAEAAATAGEAAEAARTIASDAVTQQKRTSRRRFAGVVAVLLLGGAMAYGGFDAYRHDACVRANDTRAAIVDASGLTVTQAAKELEPLRDAQRRGQRVQAEVAEDPRLMPRDC